jgi:hypothetical protein
MVDGEATSLGGFGDGQGRLCCKLPHQKWMPKAKWQFTDIFGYRQVMDQYFRLLELEYRLEFFLRIDAVSHGRKTNRR